jgi:hypothetical protein
LFNNFNLGTSKSENRSLKPARYSAGAPALRNGAWISSIAIRPSCITVRRRWRFPPACAPIIQRDHTSHGKRDARSEPSVSVATMMPNDPAKLLLAQLYDETHRAAS